jgi:hypothetical protein
VTGNEFFKAVLEQLEKAVITLYKALLLYQMKSVCSYYRNQSVVFLRGLVNLDGWDGDFKSVTDIEDALQRDSEQYHRGYETSTLRQLVDSGKKTCLATFVRTFDSLSLCRRTFAGMIWRQPAAKISASLIRNTIWRGLRRVRMNYSTMHTSGSFAPRSMRRSLTGTIADLITRRVDCCG